MELDAVARDALDDVPAVPLGAPLFLDQLAELSAAKPGNSTVPSSVRTYGTVRELDLTQRTMRIGDDRWSCLVDLSRIEMPLDIGIAVGCLAEVIGETVVSRTQRSNADGNSYSAGFDDKSDSSLPLCIDSRVVRAIHGADLVQLRASFNVMMSCIKKSTTSGLTQTQAR